MARVLIARYRKGALYEVTTWYEGSHYGCELALSEALGQLREEWGRLPSPDGEYRYWQGDKEIRLWIEDEQKRGGHGDSAREG